MSQTMQRRKYDMRYIIIGTMLFLGMGVNAVIIDLPLEHPLFWYSPIITGLLGISSCVFFYYSLPKRVNNEATEG